MTDYASLIERVRSGSGADRELDRDLMEEFVLFPPEKFTSDLSAVIWLVEKFLPEWEWLVRANPSGERVEPIGEFPEDMWVTEDAGLYMANVSKRDDSVFCPEYHNDMERAMLASFLTALQAQESGTT